MSKIIEDKLVGELASTLLTTRNFCGNLKQSAEQVFTDNELPFDEEIYQKAMTVATVEWNKVRREASYANAKAKATR